MSIAVHVFLHSSRLPSVEEWNAAIKAESFDLARDWCPPKIAQCRELLAAISGGTDDDLLDKWKVQSLQNLGLKKLLQPPRFAKIKTPPLPTEASQNVPPVIPTDRVPPVIGTKALADYRVVANRALKP